MRYLSKIHNKAINKEIKDNQQIAFPGKISVNIIKSNNIQSPFQSNDVMNINLNHPKTGPRSKPPITNEEINEVEYTKAILTDKRSFREHYWSILVSYNSVLFTFFEVSNKKLKQAKMAVFFFTITLLFGFNAVMHNTDYIDNSFNNNGLFVFSAHYPKVFYSYLFTMIIIHMCLLLAYYTGGIREIEKERDSKRIINMVRELIKRYKMKICFYFLIQFVIMIFCWYYITALCSVYRINQINWFAGSFLSFVLHMIMPLGTSLIVSGIRFISIRCKIQWLHSLCLILFI